MHKFIKLIEDFKNKYNSILGVQLVIQILFLVVTFIQLFFVIFNLVEGHEIELFYSALTIRVSVALLIIYIIFAAKNRFLTNHQAARLIDKINNDKDDTYLSALELTSKDSDQSDNPFIEKIVERTNARVDSTKLAYPKVLSRNSLIFYGYLAVGNIILFTLFANNFKTTWKAFYLSSMPRPDVDYTILYEPGDTTIVSKQDVEIKVLNFDQSLEYYLSVKRDEKWRNIPLPKGKHLLAALDYSLSYFIANEEAKTEVSTITVYEKIAVEQIKIIYDYPAYTRLASEQDTLLFGNISAIEGTNVKVLLTTNNEIADSYMIFPDGSLIEGEKVGTTIALFSLKLDKSTQYHLKVTNKYGDEYTSSTKAITVFPDLKPEITITDYPPNGKMDKNQVIPMTFRLSDDYGLQNLHLYYEINFASTIDSLLLTTINNKIYNYSLYLDLSKQRMYPGDEVTFWASVEDNLGKKHRVESDKITLRIPTLQEIFEELEMRETQQSDMMTKTLKESEILQEEFEKKRRELLNKDELEWQDKEQLKEMVSQQEQLSDNIDQSVEKLQEMIEEATKNEVLTQETLQKMERIKELMEDISTPEFKRLMEKLSEKMSELSSEDLKQALEEMKFSMEEFSQKLEQTLKMLEQMKKEQSLEKLLGLTNEMKELQEQLLELSDSPKDGSELAKQQQDIKDKLQNIKDEIDKLSEMLNSPSDQAVKDELTKMQSEVDLEALAQQMENIAQQMQDNKSQQTQSSQQDMLSQMQQMSDSMMSMMSMMSSMKSKEAEAAKDKLIRELLFFTERHQDLFKTMDSDPFLIMEQMVAQHEMVNLALNKFFSVSEVLLSLNPKFMLDLSKTMTSYNNFFVEVSDNKTHTAKANMQDIQAGLNHMTFSLLLDDDSSSGGGGGGMQDFMQQMQQMGEQQMAMNMLTQQLMQQLGQGKSMSQEMRGQMNKTSADEQQIAENLKRLIQTNPQAQKQASALNRLIEELEDVSNKLRYNRLDNELIKQQENILSRMLEATKSINKKDQSQKRKGEEAEDRLWATPEDIELRFKELENNALLEEEYKQYSKEYQKIILEYIKRLNRD